jgi:hypothetical protein
LTQDEDTIRRKRSQQRGESGKAPGGKRVKVSLDRLESDREALLRRLAFLSGSVKLRPGYKSALTLLNSKFRKSNLATRLTLLQAAQFMIEVLEKIPS